MNGERAGLWYGGVPGPGNKGRKTSPWSDRPIRRGRITNVIDGDDGCQKAFVVLDGADEEPIVANLPEGVGIETGLRTEGGEWVTVRKNGLWHEITDLASKPPAPEDTGGDSADPTLDTVTPARLAALENGTSVVGLYQQNPVNTTVGGSNTDLNLPTDGGSDFEFDTTGGTYGADSWTAGSAGVYGLSASVFTGSGSTNIAIAFKVNGSFLGVEVTADDDDKPVLSVAAVKLAAGDVVKIIASQQSGVNKTFNVQHFSVIKHR